MNITFTTTYTPKSMAVMARALRLTVRKERSERAHRFGKIAAVLAFATMILMAGLGSWVRAAMMLLFGVMMVVLLRWNDSIDGYFAYRQMLVGTKTVRTVFTENELTCITEAATTTISYDRIERIAECEDYFVLIYDKNHAQLYEKRAISDTTIEEFRAWIEQKTGKGVERI